MVVAQDEQPKPAPINVPDLFAQHDELGAAIVQHLAQLHREGEA